MKKRFLLLLTVSLAVVITLVMLVSNGGTPGSLDNAISKGSSNEEGNPDGNDKINTNERQILTKSTEEGNPDGNDKINTNERQILTKSTEKGNPDVNDKINTNERQILV